MIVTRYWIDPASNPRSEQTRWLPAVTGGLLLTIPTFAEVVDPIDPAVFVQLVSVVGAAVPFTGSPPAEYFDAAIFDGATIIDHAEFDTLMAAALAPRVPVEGALAALRAASTEPQVTSMVNKLAAVAQLTPDEKSLLAARFA
jgi:hypothetical protein